MNKIWYFCGSTYDTNPYPALLWIDWAIQNQTIIDFKKRMLSFEDLDMQVVSSIDPLEGQCYIKPIRGEYYEGNFKNIYNISSMLDDYINPPNYGKLSWKSVSSCSSDLGETLKNWQNRLHEVSMSKYTRITKYL